MQGGLVMWADGDTTVYAFVALMLLWLENMIQHWYSGVSLFTAGEESKRNKHANWPMRLL